MGITCSRNDIHRLVDQQMERADKAMLYVLQAAGEKAVTYARKNHMNNWTDQTGNLRSSIGYVVVNRGQIVKGSFSGGSGATTAKAQAEYLARNQTIGWCLIVVAGMHYASYVAAKGYDVLDGAQMEGQRTLNTITQKVIDQLSK